MRWDGGGEDGSIRCHLAAATATAVLLVGALGGWAAVAELSGAIIAPGTLVVETNVKKVQHPTGGVVGEINVRDGDEVKAGDVLLRLDETITRATFAIVEHLLDELRARQARLEAERDGAEEMESPREPSNAGFDAANTWQGEAKLFGLRRAAREGQRAQLRERILQFQEEIRGLEGQTAAKTKELALLAKELEGVRELWRKNLVLVQRLIAVERDAARVEGERGQLVAAAAQAKGRISETKLQIIQIEQDVRSEAAKELREIQARMAELEERKVAAQDRMNRIDVRAPQGGLVHQSSVHAPGAVIGPGEQLMLIVPNAEALVVEARISPQEIDKVHVGLAATLRFTAFDLRATPYVNGNVSTVAADLLTDQRTGANYYVVRISLTTEELGRLRDLKLIPGMPAEVFILSGRRTMLSYLMKPLSDQLVRTFREE